MMYFLPYESDFDAAMRDELVTAVFVRNPFERFVSAYYNKMVAKAISGQRFEQRWMIDYVLKNYRNSTDTKIRKRIPTPAEFVRFANEHFFDVRGYPVDGLDRHFRPFWSSCPFCRIDFDIIGKLDRESVIADRDAFLEAIGVEDKDVGINWHTHKQTMKFDAPKDVVFFSQVPKPLIERLYRNYEMDFKLLGYPPPNYDAYDKYRRSKGHL